MSRSRTNTPSSGPQRAVIPRRRFLGGAIAATAALGFAPKLFLRSSRAQSTRGRVLVCLFQRGAVDGLHMVVPHGESRYYDLRGNIAVPAPAMVGGALDLDGFFGLHPSMAPLMPLYDRGELAVIHACGSPDETRSHFDAQDYMETGTPGIKSTPDGWLNRHLQTFAPIDASSLRGIAVTGNIPQTLAGSAGVYAAASLLNLDLGVGRDGDLARAAIADMYEGRTDLIGNTVQETLANYEIFSSFGAYTPANGADYPSQPLGRQFREVAQVLKSDLGVEVVFLEVNGWDTHTNQGGSEGQLANQLDVMARSVAAFDTDMGTAMEDICVFTMSEFGRTAAVNGSLGTDHGHATAMLALGGTVRGGSVYTRWPGLAPDQLWQGRDLDVGTDFRSLLAEIVEKHLGNPNTEAVFPGFEDAPQNRLGLIRS